MFVLYSSVTTPMGNPGQANYVAANAAMEAVAQRRAAARLPALAVQWGPVGDTGYLARQAGVGALLAKRLGSAHLTAAEALAALPMLLQAADCRWWATRTCAGAALGGSPCPGCGRRCSRRCRAAPASPAAEVDLRELLANVRAGGGPGEGRGPLLTEEVARITKLAASRIEPGRPLVELGMDSLMAVELRLAVEQRFGLSLPVLALSEGATLQALAGRVIKMLGGGAEPAVVDGVTAMAERLARFEDAPVLEGAEAAE